MAALYIAPDYTPGTGNDLSVWRFSGLSPLDLSYYSNNQILEYRPHPARRAGILPCG